MVTRGGSQTVWFCTRIPYSRCDVVLMPCVYRQTSLPSWVQRPGPKGGCSRPTWTLTRVPLSSTTTSKRWVSSDNPELLLGNPAPSRQFALWSPVVKGLLWANACASPRVNNWLSLKSTHDLTVRRFYGLCRWGTAYTWWTTLRLRISTSLLISPRPRRRESPRCLLP